MDIFGHIGIAFSIHVAIALIIYLISYYLPKKAKNKIHKLYKKVESIQLNDSSNLAKLHGIRKCEFVPNTNICPDFRFVILLPNLPNSEKEKRKIFHIHFSNLSLIRLLFLLWKYEISHLFYKQNNDKIEIIIENAEFKALLYNKLDEISADLENGYYS